MPTSSRPSPRPWKAGTRQALPWLLALALSSCGPPAAPPASDPLADYAVFLEALKGGDVEAALSRSWLPPRGPRRQQAAAKLREAVKLLDEGVLEIDAVQARVEGPWALIVLRVTQRAADGEVLMLRDEWMLGIGGEWRVVARSRLGDSEVVKHRGEDFDSLARWFRNSDAELSARWLRGPGPAQDP